MDDFILPDELDDIDETNELHYENGMDIDEPNENINSENIPAESLSTSANFEKQETIEQYKELIERHKNLKNEEKELDNLARQLAMGIHLQVEMDKCYSLRKHFPIQIHFELRLLSTGSSLLLVKVRNESDFILTNWFLSIHIVSLSNEQSHRSDANISCTKVLRIENLSKYDDFDAELLCMNRILLPILLKPRLLKKFPRFTNTDDIANGTSHIFRLQLETHYFSYWNLIKPVPESKTLPSQLLVLRPVSHRVNKDEQIISLPEALVFLLCKENASEMELAKWLLPLNIIEKCSSKSTNSADCNFDFVLILNSRITTKCTPNQPTKIQSIHLEIRKRQKYFDISIAIRDEAFRNEFISHLQTKILVKMRYIYRELECKSGCEEITDESSSISSLFYSSISRFIS